MTESTAAIIVAAGRGTRAGPGQPKQWRLLAGRPMLAWTLDAFRTAGLTRLILVIHPDDHPLAEPLLRQGEMLVTGGADRASSVRNALEALSNAPPARVLIHDAARPLISQEVIQGVLDALAYTQGAAPALPVIDALWRGEDGQVQDTARRDGLFRAQTPQGFHYAAIRAAHHAHQGPAADDVEIARAAGLSVTITQGSEDNFKLTYASDFARAAQILGMRQGQMMDIRLGNGYDVHRFTTGDGCWLCGVLVPHERALDGHSDADVGMHALTDAIYGALAAGDIGRHFPPSDPQWKGAASHIFLRHAVDLAAKHGYRIANCDVTLVCERPKIGPHADAMRTALADIIGCDRDRVSVKATTSERLGFTGREEGIAALATACLIGPGKDTA